MEEFVVQAPIKVTQENVDDIMCTAFEGGITYWCPRAELVKQPESDIKYTHEAISRGGEIELYDAEKDEKHLLTLEKFKEGLQRFLRCENHNSCYNSGVIQDGELDCGSIDATCADMIIQYAIFGEIVYS